MTDEQDVDEAALIEKYPDAGRFCGVLPHRLLAEVARRDSLDPHFTRIWLDYLSQHHDRPALDTRTRLLALTGQFAVTRSHEHLEDVLRAALDQGLSVSDLLEVVLQSAIYAGDTAAAPALRIFEQVVGEAGKLGDLAANRLPLDGRDGERDLESERATWNPADRDDPRLDILLERLPWQGISKGLQMKPQHHLNVVEFLDGVDRDHAAAWMGFIYRGMYSRAMIDERTRLLCIVANFIALGRENEIREHMGNALHAGATDGVEG